MSEQQNVEPDFSVDSLSRENRDAEIARFVICDERTWFQIGASIARRRYLCVLSGLPGLALAFACMPVIILLLGTIWAFVFGFGDVGLFLSGWLDYLGMLFWSGLTGGMVAAVVGGILCALLGGLFVLVNWSLGSIFTGRSLVAASGGATGFVLSFFTFLGRIGPEYTGFVFSLFLTWCVVFAGHFGSLWFFTRYSGLANRINEQDQLDFRFGIQQLLAITFWVAMATAASGFWDTVWLFGGQWDRLWIPLLFLSWVPFQISVFFVQSRFWPLDPVPYKPQVRKHYLGEMVITEASADKAKREIEPVNEGELQWKYETDQGEKGARVKRGRESFL